MDFIKKKSNHYKKLCNSNGFFSFGNLLLSIFIILLASSFFFYKIFFQKKINSLDEKIIARENVIQKQDKTIAKLHKKINAMNSSFDEINFKDVVEKSKNSLQEIEQLKKENLFLQAQVNQLKKEIYDLKERNELNEDLLERKYLFLKTKSKKEYAVLKALLRIKEKELEEYKKSNFVLDKNKKYIHGGKDFTSLVVRLKTLMMLCLYSKYDMEYKAAAYRQTLKDLKQELPKDGYLKKIKLLKIYTDMPVVIKVEDEFISSDRIGDYAIDSNERMLEQLTEIMLYLDLNYLRS